ncbi:MAG: chalcone isomerase family protein [Rhodocyclaceae bacterium]
MLLILAALTAVPLLAATEVAGVKFDDRMKLGASELALNGAGLRVRVFFKVYAMGLYLAEKKSDPSQVVALKGPKRVHIVLLREVSAEDFAEALISGLKNNSSEAEFAAIRDRAEQLRAAMLEAKEVTKGTVVDLDYLPEAGTRLTIRGKAQGRDIAGEDFYQALLRIWLGAKPVQDDLKDALLGRPAG